jgi:L-threonylcarbamoyladenylate synthase
LFSRPSPTTAAHVLEDLDGRIDLVLDAGPTVLGVESTVVDLSGPGPVVLRPGAVTLEMLERVLQDVRLQRSTAQSDGAMRSPGLLTKHYAPRAPLILYEGPAPNAGHALIEAARTARSQGQRVGILATTDWLPELQRLDAVVADLGPEHAPERIAARLYAALRELDTAEVDLILACDLSGEGGLWVALRDRLRRAATQVARSG